MKRLVMLAAMLAMTVVFAAPAMAHSNSVAGDTQVQFQSSGQFVFVFAQQTNSGGAIGVAGDVGSASAASTTQELWLDVSAEQHTVQAGGGAFFMF